ncbi:MAG: hypothetical protein RQ866_08595 [Bacteroidales bacterium]|nr:hypothetical protein [Bacteroidales bacterium]
MGFSDGVADYLPEGFAAITEQWTEGLDITIKASNPRRSIMGSCRKRGSHFAVTVNNDLNPYSFLLVLTHELAHVKTFHQYGIRQVPHGKAWKTTYRLMLLQLLETDLFPEALGKAIRRYASSPQSSILLDNMLTRALSIYDNTECTDTFFLEDLPLATLFSIGNRVFSRGVRVRTRYKCRDMGNGRYYLINGVARVQTIPSAKQ